jgi:hypothetical protein
MFDDIYSEVLMCNEVQHQGDILVREPYFCYCTICNAETHWHSVGLFACLCSESCFDEAWQQEYNEINQ